MNSDVLDKITVSIDEISGAVAEISINIMPQLTGADKKQIERLKAELAGISTSLEGLEILLCEQQKKDKQ